LLIRPTVASGGERRMAIILLKAMIDFYLIRISLWRLKRKLRNAVKAEQLSVTSVV
jgi:hypothetical protein